MSAKYYRITEDTQLCGFKLLPFGLFSARKGKTYFFNREQYELVLKCDGITLLDEEKISELEKTTLEDMKKNGVVEEIEAPKELSENQKYRKFDNIYKLSVQWSVTGRCNYRCRHCFMSCPDYTESDPTFEECVNLIEQMAECGIRSISLTGGEPLIRPDFIDIVRELKNHEIIVSSILTNGALVNEELLDKLEEVGVHPAFQMSFDGVGWHDWIRGIDGAEVAVEKAFKLLKKRGYSTSAAMCLHKHNKDTIRQTVNTLADWGCSGLKINVAAPEGLWVDQPEHFIDHEEGYQAYFDYIPYFYEDGCPIGLMLEDTFVYDTDEKRAFVLADREEGEEKKRYVCMPLRTGFYLGPKGQVLPCQSFIAKDIASRYQSALEVPLREILSKSNYVADTTSKLEDLLTANKECAECEWAQVCCGGCRAEAIGTHDMNYFSKNEMMCNFFRNGWFGRFCDYVKEKNEIK